jgi:flagellar biosynthesis chaperone FliJ
MSKDGQRYAAELKRLEDRKKELEDALGRLARDEADAEEVMELAKEVELLEEQVATARAAAQSQEKTMTKNDQHLIHMGEKQRRLYDALVNATEAEADAMYAQLADKLNLPKIDVSRSKRPATTVTEKSIHDVRKAAATNREAAERQLDELAKSIQQPGESFHKAYDRALNTDMGKALMQTRDDAQELERGGVTSMELDEARKSLAR